MKRIIYFTYALIILLSINGCKKDDKNKSALSLNTWRIDVNNSSVKSSVVYTQITGSFSTQGYQLLEMKGDDNLGLDHCWLRIYFNTIGPPPSGTYTVTSYNNLSRVQNAVAINSTSNANSNIDVIHWAEENQTIHVIFANGTLEVKFDDINIFREGGFANSHAKLSVNLRK
ncbi:MAG: hypothetical protein EOO88_61335 [Pedobacter sp.]|nr:MAG: hypothetical protein EOO88_61335 [Pedobacter sp.]